MCGSVCDKQRLRRFQVNAGAHFIINNLTFLLMNERLLGDYIYCLSKFVNLNNYIKIYYLNNYIKYII
jgi:hypothetical protein